MYPGEYIVETRRRLTDGTIEWVRFTAFETLDEAVRFCDRRLVASRVVLSGSVLYSTAD